MSREAGSRKRLDGGGFGFVISNEYKKSCFKGMRFLTLAIARFGMTEKKNTTQKNHAGTTDSPDAVPGRARAGFF